MKLNHPWDFFFFSSGLINIAHGLLSFWYIFQMIVSDIWSHLVAFSTGKIKLIHKPPSPISLQVIDLCEVSL